MLDLILPTSVTRTAPDWFRTKLRDTDRNLTVYFNPIRQRWVIDRYINCQCSEHSGTCERTNVVVLQDEDGSYMPLCDAAIDQIRRMDAWNQHGSYENFHRHNSNKSANAKAKSEQAIRQMHKERSADDKRQLRELQTLIQRHNLT